MIVDGYQKISDGGEADSKERPARCSATGSWRISHRQHLVGGQLRHRWMYGRARVELSARRQVPHRTRGIQFRDVHTSAALLHVAQIR